MVHKSRATSNAPLPAITHIHHIRKDMVPYRQLCKSYSVPPQSCCANSVSHQPHNEGSSDAVKHLYPPAMMVQSMDMPAYSAASLPNTQVPCQRFCHIKTVGVSKAVGIRKTSHMLMNRRISPMLGLYSEVCDAMANLLYSAGQNRYTAAAAHKIAKNFCRLPALGSAPHAFQTLNSARASDRTNNMPIIIIVINLMPPYRFSLQLCCVLLFSFANKPVCFQVACTSKKTKVRLPETHQHKIRLSQWCPQSLFAAAR